MRGAVNLLRLLRSQWDSPAALRQRQSRELVRLVHHAYARVPYYRRLFDAAGLSPGEIRGLDDLRRIPLTSKQDLQRRPAPFLANAGEVEGWKEQDLAVVWPTVARGEIQDSPPGACRTGPRGKDEEFLAIGTMRGWRT